MTRIRFRVALAVTVATALAVTAAPITGHALTRAAATSRSTCAASQVRVTTATERARYRIGQTVGVSTSVTNMGPGSCAVNIRSCVNATITDSSGTLVWSAVPLNALCALFIVHQVLRPGQSVSRSWAWDQHVCLIIGRCPGAQVPPGSYTARGHWGSPFGDAAPAVFRIT